MTWAGDPSRFSLIYPYIVAFDSSFIEIREVESGNLQQIIYGSNIKLLSDDPKAMECVSHTNEYDPESQHVFRLKLTDEFLE
jgi:RHO1 GDP-GTP exchange protein 1/2